MILEVTDKNYAKNVRKIKSMMKVTHLMHNEGSWSKVEKAGKERFSILKNRPWHFTYTDIIAKKYGYPFLENKKKFPSPFSLVFSYDEKDKNNNGTLFMVSMKKRKRKIKK